MKMSQGVEWAIHCCALLASLPAEVTMRLEKIAEFYDLPLPYLRKQFQALSRAGIVTTTTGPQGGYRLAKTAAEPNLLQIYIAIEGDDPCFKCNEIRQQGPTAAFQKDYARPCGIARIMWNAERAWRRELEKATLAELVSDAAKEIDPAKQAASAKWIAACLAER